MKRGLESPDNKKDTKRLKPCPEISAVTCESEWQGGQSQLITWNVKGDVPGVKLWLYNQSDSETSTSYQYYMGQRLPITTNLSAGSCLVTVPTGMTPGMYRLKVESTASIVVHAHSGIIRIDEGRTPPALSDVTTAIEWTGGARQRITWNYQGDVPTVELRLCQVDDTMSLGTKLHRKLTNEGSCIVIAPAGLPSGSYLVRVSSSTNLRIKALSEALQLNQDGAPPAILDVAATSEDWKGGALQQITWRHQGFVPSVSVSLYTEEMAWSFASSFLGVEQAPAEEYVSSLHSRHPNSGSCSITVPTGLPPGEYRVKVRSTASPETSGTSQDVWIDRGRTPPEIMDVTTSQRIWHSASRQRITWRHRGAVPLVGVYLYTRAEPSEEELADPDFSEEDWLDKVQNLELRVENLGFYSVTVPSGLPPGTYHVRIQSSSTRKVMASSADILIDDDHRERCVQYALGLLGLRRPRRLPYSVVKKIAVMAATE